MKKLKDYPVANNVLDVIRHHRKQRGDDVKAKRRMMESCESNSRRVVDRIGGDVYGGSGLANLY